MTGPALRYAMSRYLDRLARGEKLTLEGLAGCFGDELWDVVIEFALGRQHDAEGLSKPPEATQTGDCSNGWTSG